MILSCHSIHQSYTQGNASLNILNNVGLEVDSGQVVGLIGPSGSGKSTLLHILGLLEQPQSGELSIAGNHVHLSHFSDSQRTNVRRKHIGFVYQFHHLLPQFTALENVAMPLILNGYSKADALKKGIQALDKLGLNKRHHHLPRQLSGGEQQRTAIARALIHNPALILADEPTGNLDHETAHLVFQEMLGLIQENGMGALIATHDLNLANQMDRRLYVRNGRLLEEDVYKNGSFE